MKYLLSAFIFLLAFTETFAQGDLAYLKKNFYLQQYWEKPFDCDSLPADGITSVEDRICANLRLQWADSTLGVYYEMVLEEMARFEDDTLVRHFEEVQSAWRAYRDRHCKTLHGGYVTSTGAVIYMDEMRWLTEIRIAEMKALLKLYQGY